MYSRYKATKRQKMILEKAKEMKAIGGTYDAFVLVQYLSPAEHQIYLEVEHSHPTGITAAHIALNTGTKHNHVNIYLTFLERIGLVERRWERTEKGFIYHPAALTERDPRAWQR